MDVSIIIVTRNTRESTCSAIRSVIDSDDALEKEIILIDNGSTDGTAEIVGKDFPAVKCVRSPRNLGFAKAVNLGTGSSTGEFLLLLNSDARLEPDALHLAVSFMRENPRCGIAGAQLLNLDGTRQNSVANFPSLATELLNKSLLRRLFKQRFPGKEQHNAEPISVESIVGAFFLTRRSVWEQLGGLDERFFFFLEETDFCLRARRRNWETRQLPNVRVWHEQGKSAKQASAAARIEYWRSRYAYFQKHHATWKRAVLRIGLMLRLLLDILSATLVVLVTFGSAAKWRHKLLVQTAIARWHLAGLPASTGLPR